MNHLFKGPVPWLLTTLTSFAVSVKAQALPIYPGQDRTFPFHDAAGTNDTSAVPFDDPHLVSWASRVASIEYGPEVSELFKNPKNALGAATNDRFDIVSLGRGGSIVLNFDRPIVDGPGPDFAVFENAFSDTFLELAFVEVSSDGERYVRFPTFSYTGDPVTTFSTIGVSPRFIHGFAGKYRSGFGTPFDLSQIKLAYDAAVAGLDNVFSNAYRAQLLENFSFVDLNRITHIRIVDVVGDGQARDSDGAVIDSNGVEGAPIYDPYPTFASAGFDLEAVGVLNEVTSKPIAQSIYFAPIPNLRAEVGRVPIYTGSSSGLPVTVEIIRGPASLELENPEDSFLSIGEGTGEVLLKLTQEGGTAEGITYAPANPVTYSFDVVPLLSDEVESYQEWADRLENGAPEEDSDSDTIPNLIEYSILFSDTKGRPPLLIGKNIEGAIVLRYKARRDVEAIVRLEYRQALTVDSPGEWSSLSGLEHAATATVIDDYVETVVVLPNEPTQQPTNYFRLRAETFD